MREHLRLSLSEIERLAFDALLSAGFSAAQAGAIADNVTAAERDGCTSHGLYRIPFYLGALANQRCDPQAVPELIVNERAVVHVDAGSGFCPLALRTGLPALTETARRHGIAALAIRRTYNIAALWPEVEQLAASGLVAFAFTGSNASVAPAGGTRPLYGTNPMAFGFPRDGPVPFVFDQASSACARGEIELRRRDGRRLEPGWAIDADGWPTEDPAAALDGAQLPFGGHKGAALALMVELLAGALIGELFSVESSERDVHGIGAPFGGEFLIAIDPGACAAPGQSAIHTARAEQLFERVLAQPGTRLPSARRHAARERHRADGVPVDAELVGRLRARAGSRSGIGKAT